MRIAMQQDSEDDSSTDLVTLWQRAQAGEQNGLAQWALIEAGKSKVLWRMIRDSHAREDIVAEAASDFMIKFNERKIDVERQPTGFLHRIVQNKIVDELRRRKTKKSFMFNREFAEANKNNSWENNIKDSHNDIEESDFKLDRQACSHPFFSDRELELLNEAMLWSKKKGNWRSYVEILYLSNPPELNYMDRARDLNAALQKPEIPKNTIFSQVFQARKNIREALRELTLKRPEEAEELILRLDQYDYIRGRNRYTAKTSGSAVG